MNCSHDEAASRHSENQRRCPDSAFLIFDYHKSSPSAPIGVKASDAIAVFNSGLAKVRRAVFGLDANPAERLAQNLQYRRAAMRNATPTKRALRPPAVAKMLPFAESLSSA